MVTLFVIGIGAGLLAGLLGVGGGVLMVPVLIGLGVSPVQAFGTSNLAILITSISGTWQNWRSGNLQAASIWQLGLPAIATAQLGVFLAQRLPGNVLLLGIAGLYFLNIFLVELRQWLNRNTSPDEEKPTQPSLMSVLITGALGGVLAGLFGIGGGTLMVPLQVLLMGVPIKTAVQTSLGVIIVTACSALSGYAVAGDVLWVQGFWLGLGGLLGVQVTTRLLPKLPAVLVQRCFQLLLLSFGIYFIWKAQNP
ncbi:sulfite exporter TauE/SafE family protein [Synechococcus elongatus]|uniref:sulfite exporter TauE/SafE family protein n=1 Tax=Synechococcus elongatus TaxID=32046 RepID=UPI000F7F96CD|nr:sulfite exporter TauE/SafE family protein [Synechococcus elongatus]